MRVRVFQGAAQNSWRPVARARSVQPLYVGSHGFETSIIVVIVAVGPVGNVGNVEPQAERFPSGCGNREAISKGDVADLWEGGRVFEDSFPSAAAGLPWAPAAAALSTGCAHEITAKWKDSSA